LIAVRIGRNANHDFQRFRAIHRQSGLLTQLLAKGGQQFSREFNDRDLAAVKIDPGGRAGALQQTLDGAEHRPVTSALDSPGIPAETAFAAAYRDERREPLPGLSVGRFESDKRIVSAVSGRSDDTSSAEVNSKFHEVAK